MHVLRLPEPRIDLRVKSFVGSGAARQKAVLARVDAIPKPGSLPDTTLTSTDIPPVGCFRCLLIKKFIMVFAGEVTRMLITIPSDYESRGDMVAYQY